MIWKIGGTIIATFWRHQQLSFFLAIIASFLYPQPAVSDFARSDAAASSSAITKSDVSVAIDYVSGIQRTNFEIFSTLVRTYKVIPSDNVEWPSSTGPITYWGGGIVDLLSFQNIVMLIHEEGASFEELSASSGATDAYIRRFNLLFSKMSRNNSACYFERFTSRRRWISKGVIIVELAKSNMDRGKLLKECASAGSDFINGLPFASNQATLDEMPPQRVRGALIGAVYTCSLQRATNIEKPETSRDGLAERPSKECVIDHLKNALNKSGE